jgi:hypothetical protein
VIRGFDRVAPKLGLSLDQPLGGPHDIFGHLANRQNVRFVALVDRSESTCPCSSRLRQRQPC